MNSPSARTYKVSIYFWLFIIIHSILWTIGPALLRYSVPHDTLEGITWGLQWQFGYSKHPFFTAWLCAGITQLFGVVGWPVYLLAQLAILLTFYAAWKLARYFLEPIQALIASLALEGVFFYNINSFNLTPDSLQSPLWALLALFFYQALITQKIRSWLGVGLFAALAVCTKYQAALLLLPMLLFCIFNPQARLSFRRSGFYFALAVFILLIAPHFIWLYKNNFITLNYALNITGKYTANKTSFSHLTNPINFLINNCLSVLGLFVLFWPFYKQSKDMNAVENHAKLSNFQWQFLIYIGLGPFLLSLLLCIITGNHFVSRWSTPYYFTLGIIVLAYLKPILTHKNIKQFTLSLIIFSLLLFIGRMTTLAYYSRPNSDAFLPNKEIAAALAKLWHVNYSTPLPFLAGSNYLVTGVLPYIADRPKPYLNCRQSINAWINEQEIHKSGGIFIIDEAGNYSWDNDSIAAMQPLTELMQRFPKLQWLPKLTFYRKSNHGPVIIWVGILPPQDFTNLSVK